MYISQPRQFIHVRFHVNALVFVEATLKKGKKNHYLAVFYSIKTNFLMTGKIEIWHLGFLSPLVCPCIISCHCIDFCGSQAQKGTKDCNFAVFYSIKTNFLMSRRLDIWNVRSLPPLVCPCKVSCQCLNYFTICTQITTKKRHFSAFYSIYSKKSQQNFLSLTW